MFGEKGEQQRTNIYVWETDENVILSEAKTIIADNEQFIKDIDDIADAHKDEKDLFSKILGWPKNTTRMQDLCKPTDIVVWKTKVVKIGSTGEIFLVELIERLK